MLGTTHLRIVRKVLNWNPSAVTRVTTEKQLDNQFHLREVLLVTIIETDICKGKAAGVGKFQNGCSQTFPQLAEGWNQKLVTAR